MPRAWLGLGANIGDPAAQLAEAVRRLDALPDVRVTKRSPMLATKAWGRIDQPDFQNMVVEVETALGPLPLLEACLAVETDMGRIRCERWGPRVIDIDVIAYERQVMATDRLTLPHPLAHERDFVLVPLRIIAPEVAEWIEART